MSSHGFELDQDKVGGFARVSRDVSAEFAAAAVSADDVVLLNDYGESFRVAMDQVNPDTVELACIEDGCVLIQDDGNSKNDVILPGM